MSIKKSFLKKGRVCVLPLLVSAWVLCLIPAKGYGWYHHPKTLDVTQNRDGLPEFKDKRTVPGLTKTYRFLQNRGQKEKTPILYPDSEGAGISAGSINVDMPFDVLSKNVISPGISLDRQIAADLRLKRVMDEYRSLKKRNAEVLNGLGIPYLEKKDDFKINRPDSVAEKIKAEREAGNTLENVIVFSGGGGGAPVNQQTVVSQVTGALKKEKQNIALAGDISKFRPSPGYSGQRVQTLGGNSYQTASGGNTELPWLFFFALKVIRYAVDNKLEIFLWAAVLTMFGLISILVVKR